MNRRTFFASFVTVVGAVKFWKPVTPPLTFHRDSFAMAMEPIRSTSRPDELLIVSGGNGYLYKNDGHDFYWHSFEVGMREVNQ